MPDIEEITLTVHSVSPNCSITAQETILTSIFKVIGAVGHI